MSRQVGRKVGRQSIIIIRLRHTLWLCPLVLGLALCGCGDSEPTIDSSRDSETAATSAAPDEPTSTADTAEAALLAVVRGFKQNRPETVWEFLPAGHQQQINLLVRDFGNRMDPELWSRTAEVARKLSGVLKNRKTAILSHPAVRQGQLLPVEQLASKWDGLVALLETLANSELSDVEMLKSFDGRRFLASFNAESLGQLRDLTMLLSLENPFSMLNEMVSGASVTLVDENNGVATVRIEPVHGQRREYRFVRVEGKWFPEDWADGLQEDIRAARARFDVELAPEVLAQKKELMLPFLEDAGRILERLEQAVSDEEFHAVMTEEVLKPVLLIVQNSSAGMHDGDKTNAPAPSPAGSQPVAADALWIVIPQELDEETIEEIVDRLLDGGDGVDREVTDQVRPGRTVFVVSPVKQIDAYAKSIKFGRVRKIDLVRRTITVELSMPRAKKSGKDQSILKP